MDVTTRMRIQPPWLICSGMLSYHCTAQPGDAPCLGDFGSNVCITSNFPALFVLAATFRSYREHSTSQTCGGINKSHPPNFQNWESSRSRMQTSVFAAFREL